jgi:hypothetical protein
MISMKWCFLFFLILCGKAYSVDDAENLRKKYATQMHEAFILQSKGHTTRAYYHFKSARQQALANGESPAKVRLIEDLFGWYRKHGYSLKLMPKPSGCTDESRSCFSLSSPQILATVPDYKSEWGNDPVQAGRVRDFMFGVGEVISGVLCISIGSFTVKAGGLTMLTDGLLRMWNSGNQAWTEHEMARIEFKKWEARAKALD